MNCDVSLVGTLAEGLRGYAGTVLGLAFGAIPTLVGAPTATALAAGAGATAMGYLEDQLGRLPGRALRWRFADQWLKDAVTEVLVREDG
jgi:hypothetical protein